MTRLEFCHLMGKVKAEADITISELSFHMKMLLPTLRRFELGKHNFNLQLVITYLQKLQCRLQLSDNETHYIINDYDNILAAFIAIHKTRNISQRELAPMIGLSKTGVGNIESRVSKLTIDSLLKLCELFDVQIEIVKQN